MLKSITIKRSHDEPLVVPANGITIFVGPNNSGKSLALREIDTYLFSDVRDDWFKLLAGIDVEWPDDLRLSALIDGAKNKHAALASVPADHLELGSMNPNGSYETAHVHEPGLRSTVEKKQNVRRLCQNLLRYYKVKLDGRSRFQLSQERESGDIFSAPQNLLQLYMANEERRTQLQNSFKEAFGWYLAFDPTAMQKIRLRVNESPPFTPTAELSFTPEAVAYHRSGRLLTETSDGVQAYAGILLAVCSGAYKTIVIDEPEAFLHPPLARKLGSQLASIAKKQEASLFAATHSADFLLGCIESKYPVHVVRMQYRSGWSGARLVDNDTLAQFFNDPIFRSTNVISSLFYDAVIVTESDGDRVFYSEIIHRLFAGIDNPPSILVLNAHNKQTVRNIVGPLRKFGVPAAAVVDIDILKDGGKVWAGWLDASNFPEALRDGMHAMRHSVERLFSQLGIEMRAGGVTQLRSADRAACEALLSSLEEVGVFAVPTGELERWLPDLGDRGSKNAWVERTLVQMGNDPTASGYLHPSEGDVWEFMRRVVDWCTDSDRKGL